MRRRNPWLVAALALAGGCAAPPPRPFAVEVRALTDEDEPLRGIPVAVNGSVAGTTDGAGRLRLSRSEVEGTRLAVQLETPRGYRPAIDPPPLVLRRMSRVIDGVARELPVEHLMRFAPLQREYAVLVDVGTAGLPVEAFGARRAVTNARGVASFLYKGSPGDELAVQVSSDGHDELKPKVVSANFVLASRSEAYLVEGRFEPKPPPPPPRRVPQKRVRPVVPRRL
jgi:hypothetical protein